MHYHNNIAKDGRWYRALIKVHGRYRRRSFPTRRLAELWLERQYAEREGLTLPADPAGVALGELVAAYLARCVAMHRSAATLEHYRALAERVLGGLGPGLGAGAVRQADVLAYLAHRRADGGGEARILKEIAFLRACYRDADEPMLWKVPPLRPAQGHRRLVTDAELGRLWPTLAGDLPTRRAVLLALLTGMRPSEVTAARGEWVDHEARTIRVAVAKTGRENLTALVPTLAAELEGVAAGPLVPLSEVALRHRLWRRSQRAGVAPPLTGTARLRSTCSTWAHEAGYTQEQVGELLAHVKPGVTRVYLHAQAVHLKREMLEAVERRFLAAIHAT